MPLFTVSHVTDVLYKNIGRPPLQYKIEAREQNKHVRSRKQFILGKQSSLVMCPGLANIWTHYLLWTPIRSEFPEFDPGVNLIPGLDRVITKFSQNTMPLFLGIYNLHGEYSTFMLNIASFALNWYYQNGCNKIRYVHKALKY